MDDGEEGIPLTALRAVGEAVIVAVEAERIFLGDDTVTRALRGVTVLGRPVVDRSVGVGEEASERESVREVARECNDLVGAGDRGALDEGGVGTTARASWSLRIEISLFASSC